MIAWKSICKVQNIKIKNCKFEHVPKAVFAFANGNTDIIDKIEITDNEISFTDHGAIDLRDGQRWGKTTPPFGELIGVKILRNKFYQIGQRPVRGASPFAISIHSGKIVEIAGNILEKIYGGGITVFGGKHHDLRDCPLIKVFIHHNKVSDCLLHTNDYGGIEIWQGGPCFVYNNISINPGGYRRGDYMWVKENNRKITYT